MNQTQEMFSTKGDTQHHALLPCSITQYQIPERVLRQTNTLNRKQSAGEPLKPVSSTIYHGQMEIGISQDNRELTNQTESYCGLRKNGLKHGTGKLIFFNGDFYKGHFQDGLMHGFGIMKIEKLFLTGFWNRGKRQGEFFSFGLNKGQAMEIIYNEDQAIQIRKLNHFHEVSSPVEQAKKQFQKMKKILCLKILQLEKLNNSLDMVYLDKRSSHFSREIKIEKIRNLSLYKGTYFVVNLMIWVCVPDFSANMCIKRNLGEIGRLF